MPDEYHPHALREAEADIRARLAGVPVDIEVQRTVSNLYRAATVVSRRAEREILADEKLSWSGFVTLWVLWVWGEMDSTRLASEVGLTPGTVTGVRKGLERDGWVESRRGDEDARRVMVRLTENGAQRFDTLYPAFNEWSCDVLGSIAGEETSQLADLLERIVLGSGPSAPDDPH